MIPEESLLGFLRWRPFEERERERERERESQQLSKTENEIELRREEEKVVSILNTHRRLPSSLPLLRAVGVPLLRLKSSSIFFPFSERVFACLQRDERWRS